MTFHRQNLIVARSVVDQDPDPMKVNWMKSNTVYNFILCVCENIFGTIVLQFRNRN
jgi:hypothetical protein